jgi:DNA-binding response OmpR family regulator
MLVVDDEPGIGSLVALCLDRMDVDVVMANGRADALRAARANDIGLVLLDLALGNEDGLGILPDLRNEPSLAGVPIVAFTAHDSRRQEAFDQGVDAVLKRPFSSTDLSSTVEAHRPELSSHPLRFDLLRCPGAVLGSSATLMDEDRSARRSGVPEGSWGVRRDWAAPRA